MMDEVKNPVILSVIHHRQIPQESTSLVPAWIWLFCDAETTAVTLNLMGLENITTSDRRTHGRSRCRGQDNIETGIKDVG
jgi:hypothetical protein